MLSFYLVLIGPETRVEALNARCTCTLRRYDPTKSILPSLENIKEKHHIYKEVEQQQQEHQ